ncbi:hypothetical protein Fot_07609 [Forsythia ovata]|uniref:Uncharacterized protein n=1 Tax=Forsythia ovata TaxID=205694 RepID=A0ABD1WX09_9LAMI
MRVKTDDCDEDNNSKENCFTQKDKGDNSPIPFGGVNDENGEINQLESKANAIDCDHKSAVKTKMRQETFTPTLSILPSFMCSVKRLFKFPCAVLKFRFFERDSNTRRYKKKTVYSYGTCAGKHPAQSDFYLSNKIFLQSGVIPQSHQPNLYQLFELSSHGFQKTSHAVTVICE